MPGWLAATGDIALDAVVAMAARHGVTILSGTVPCLAGMTGEAGDIPTYLNRAYLHNPRRRTARAGQAEPDAAGGVRRGGVTVNGTAIDVIERNGLRIAVMICLDTEFTHLWARLARLNIDLVIVPAKTDMITGYNRVFSCARARAIELQTPVCVLGAVGVPLGQPATDTGVGGASVFLPCDTGISLDGIHAALPPQTAAMLSDPVLAAVHIPVGACRRLRNGLAEAEICPAIWDASHLTVDDPAGMAFPA